MRAAASSRAAGTTSSSRRRCRRAHVFPRGRASSASSAVGASRRCAVRLFLPEAAVHHFTGWTYRHASGAPRTLKPYGIFQVGRNADAAPPARDEAWKFHAGEPHYVDAAGAYTAAYPRIVDRASPGVC